MQARAIIESDSRVMLIFFIADTSGSMYGPRIEALNQTFMRAADIVADLQRKEIGALIKIAVLQFDNDARWNIQPTPVDHFSMPKMTTELGRVTDLAAAYTELESKLHSTSGFIRKSAKAMYRPAFILISDGVPTCSAASRKAALDKLRKNDWFAKGIKSAIALDTDTNKDILAEFTGNEKTVIDTREIGGLDKALQVLSVSSVSTSSMSSSSNRSNDDDPSQVLATAVEDAKQEANMTYGPIVQDASDYDDLDL